MIIILSHFKFKEKALNDYINKMMGQMNSTGAAGSNTNYADRVSLTLCPVP